MLEDICLVAIFILKQCQRSMKPNIKQGKSTNSQLKPWLAVKYPTFEHYSENTSQS